MEALSGCSHRRPVVQDAHAFAARDVTRLYVTRHNCRKRSSVFLLESLRGFIAGGGKP